MHRDGGKVTTHTNTHTHVGCFNYSSTSLAAVSFFTQMSWNLYLLTRLCCSLLRGIHNTVASLLLILQKDASFSSQPIFFPMSYYLVSMQQNLLELRHCYESDGCYLHPKSHSPLSGWQLAQNWTHKHRAHPVRTSSHPPSAALSRHVN